MNTCKIRFVFHNPKGERGIGKAIVAWTWLLGCLYNWKVLKYNFSHVEIHLPDEDGYFQTHQGEKNIGFTGLCFSSTTRGDANGVRFALASEVLHHADRWSYIECDVDPERLEVALEEAKKLIGGGYDYGYVLSFVQPFIVQKDADWACSEIIDWFAFLCRVAGIDKIHKRVSPRRFAYLLAKKHGEPKPLI